MSSLASKLLVPEPKQISDQELKRTVKPKKYSVVGNNGKHHDVTCPNQNVRGLVIDGSDNDITEAAGKKTKIEK